MAKRKEVEKSMLTEVSKKIKKDNKTVDELIDKIMKEVEVWVKEHKKDLIAISSLLVIVTAITFILLNTDGKAGVYRHGEVKSDVATIELISFDKNQAPETNVAETNYELLSDEDFEVNKNLF